MQFTYRIGIQYIKKLSDRYSTFFNHSIGFDFDRYFQMANSNCDSKLKEALEKVIKRMPDKFGDDLYYSQILYYDVTRVLFPGVISVLPDMIHDDWLGSLSYEICSRDHIVHQPMVAYIAKQLLSITLPTSGDSLFDFIVRSITSVQESAPNYIHDYMKTIGGFQSRIASTSRDLLVREAIETTITIASLYHDIGYPWQVINKLSNHLSGASNNISSVNFNLSQFVNEYHNRMFFLPFAGYNNDPNLKTVNSTLVELVAEKTHSLYSSLCLLTLKDSLASYPATPSLYNFCVEWAALGILMHDVGKIYASAAPEDKLKRPIYPYLRLSFSKDPISSLLVLADYLQEFNRPRAKFTKIKGTLKVEYVYNCKKCSIETIGNKWLIKFYYDKLTREIESSAQTDCDRLFDKHYGFLDISDIGVSEVNVECVQEQVTN